MRYLVSISTVLLTLVATVNAATIHVPADQPTIQAGIDAAVNGDTVLVSSGSYSENLVIQDKAVHVVAEAGPLETHHLWTQSFGNCVIFRNCPEGSYSGFGVTVQSDYEPTGIKVINSNVTISNNWFFGGTSVRNFIEGSATEAHLVTITHNLFSHLQVYNAMILFANGLPVKFENNTVDSVNRAVAAYADGCAVKNNIFVNCYYAIHFQGNLTSQESHNCFWNNEANFLYQPENSTDAVADPQFVSAATGDYRLQNGSRCINTGDPNPIYNDPDGSRCDMGAYPTTNGIAASYPLALGIALAPLTSKGLVKTRIPTISCDYYDPESSAPSASQIQVGSDNDWTVAEMWDTGPVVGVDTSALYSGAILDDDSTYYVRVRFSNGVNWSEWSERTFTVRLSRTIYVPQDTSSVGAAVSMSESGDTVIVDDGTYIEDFVDFEGKSLIVRSKNGPTRTTIRALGGFLFVFQNGGDTSTVLSGFTIFSGVDPVFCSNSSPTISHNIILAQWSHLWGAITLQGNAPAHIINNTIIYAGGYAAINSASTSPPTIVNNIIAFSGNFGIVASLAPPALSHNAVFDNGIDYFGVASPGPGSILIDPLLDANFALLPSSPCIDAGDPNPMYNDPDGSRSDIGALPYSWVLGDADGFGSLNIGDAVYLIDYIFHDGNAPVPAKVGDLDSNCSVDIGDVAYLVAAMFGDGPPPDVGCAP